MHLGSIQPMILMVYVGGLLLPIGSMVMVYLPTFTIN